MNRARPDQIAHQQTFHQVSAQQKKPSDEPKIPAAIIQLFHLLPPAPEKFMEKLALLTIQLELKLPAVGAFSLKPKPCTSNPTPSIVNPKSYTLNPKP